ncbi:hypothetical protein D9Q98_006714 [Chlorella vulgaris]|uniref:Uncharacterized protein n=1 Tax=Chlorella vulgaris TaxID=3077 RepID=A0A9D4TKQ5_CHLVU|nr:hypothetical protein D9Q98_006714 [Chlorella vulgaris]
MIALALLVPLALCTLSAGQDFDLEPKRPVWPDEYQISWDFTVPYIDEYMPQKQPFKYTYEAWQDSRLGRQKVVRNGVETVLLLVPVNKMYEVFPAYDHLICWEDEIHGGTGPTQAGAAQGATPAAPAAHTTQAPQAARQAGGGSREATAAAAAAAGAAGGGKEAAGWLGVRGEQVVGGGRPLSQQRRRLLAQGEEELEVEAGAAADEARFEDAAAVPSRQPQQDSTNLFDWQKKPAKLLQFLLPDLSEDRWAYLGTEVFKESGDTARVYQWDLSAGGTSEMRYRFYVTREGAPLRLWMRGTNLYTGGHKDEYIATYRNYKPGPLSHETFQLPEGIAAADCVPAAPEAALARAARAAAEGGAHAAAAAAAAPAVLPGALRDQFSRHMPSMHWGHAAYDGFVHRFGRRHRHDSEYQARRDVFAASQAFVQGWSAKRQAHLAAAAGLSANSSAAAAEGGPVPHEVALNHLADWTREEYLAVIKPDRGFQRLLAAEQEGVRLHRVSVPPHMVPAEVIWRGSPADSPVKDQAACGGCWSFSVVGALEAAWFRETGKQLLFSEQHMIDCGWEGGNKGCFGGDQIRALNWMFKRGGLASQADYPYQGINNFCRTDVAEKKFEGHWVLVEGGQEALKEALLTKGPMIVSIDASDDAFRFYSGGLYTNPQCATAPADLDHAVIISGFGTDEEDEDYWLVKNIWSPFWGEGGYMRVSRSPNDCGVSAEPVYIDLKPGSTA